MRFRVKITCEPLQNEDEEYDEEAEKEAKDCGAFSVEKVVTSHNCLNWAVALALVGGQPTRLALEVAKIVHAVFMLARCDGDTPEERQFNRDMLATAQNVICYWSRYDAEFKKRMAERMAELDELDEPTGGHK